MQYHQPVQRPRIRDERGAVSIFLVIFFALLIGVITMSFIGIVIRDVNQSTNNDLSRSAYDSSQAGVEDAKRAIALYANACNAQSAQCGLYKSYLDNKQCQALRSFSSLGLAAGTGNEVKVQSTGSDAFDQAYTCVNVTMNTPDYINSQAPYQSDVIPLKTVDASGAAFTPSSFNLSWFNRSDAPGMGDTDSFSAKEACNTDGGGSTCYLPTQANWDPYNQYKPSLMRVQLIAYNEGAINDDELQNSTKTLFLYPSESGVGGGGTIDFNQNTTPPLSDAAPPIIPIHCGGNGLYACNINLSLAGYAGKTLLLRVTPVYKKTTFRIGLADNALFDGVQPLVDSTGRANSLFRRVQARVRMQNEILYPEYAVDVNNSLCKDFAVGTDPNDFVNNCN